ncbi:UNVERIFIED_CONTAM: hypothetical protein HDU68_006719, partial [Siphonaria sp. JEL0065]
LVPLLLNTMSQSGGHFNFQQQNPSELFSVLIQFSKNLQGQCIDKSKTRTSNPFVTDLHSQLVLWDLAHVRIETLESLVQV